MLLSQRMNENEVKVVLSPLKEDNPIPKKYLRIFDFKRRKIVPLSDTQLLPSPGVFYLKSDLIC